MLTKRKDARDESRERTCSFVWWFSNWCCVCVCFGWMFCGSFYTHSKWQHYVKTWRGGLMVLVQSPMLEKVWLFVQNGLRSMTVVSNCSDFFLAPETFHEAHLPLTKHQTIRSGIKSLRSYFFAELSRTWHKKTEPRQAIRRKPIRSQRFWRWRNKESWRWKNVVCLLSKHQEISEDRTSTRPRIDSQQLLILTGLSCYSCYGNKKHKKKLLWFRFVSMLFASSAQALTSLSWAFHSRIPWPMAAPSKQLRWWPSKMVAELRSERLNKCLWWLFF